MTTCVLAAASPARADADADGADEDEDLSDLSLEELLAVEVVTASNMSESQSRAPGVVIRLTREDLEARGYHELLDLFDDLPGMDIVRPWGDDYLKVYWRGYRTDVTFPFLLLLDGQVLNSLWSGDGSVAAAVPMSEVDHVEIVYGPVSAVYGANAFMGVVNVITLAGAGKTGSSAHVRATTGTYGGDRLDRRVVDAAVVEDKGDWRLSVAARLALDWTDARASERFEYTRAVYANDPRLWGGYLGFENLAQGASSPINEYGLDARLTVGDLEIGAHDLSLATGYGTEYPTDQAQPHAIWDQRERSVYASYKEELAKNITSRTLVRWRDSGIPNDSYYLNGFNDGMGRRVVEASYWQALNRSQTVREDVEVQRWEWLGLTAGARYEHKDLASKYDVSAGADLTPDMIQQDVELPSPPVESLREIERPQTDDYGIYAQGRLRKAHVFGPNDTHALHVGLRYDRNSVFGAEHSPTLRIAYVGELENCRGLFLGKLLYGEGWQEPNPRQLYGGWLGSGSNPTLRPENSRTLELDLSHTTEHVSNLVSVYYARNYDTIVQFAGGATNKGRRDVVGVDYHLRALWRPHGFDSVSLWGYYSYLWSRELRFDAMDQEIRAPIGDLATHKVWLGGTAKLKGRITATVRSRATSERKTVSTNPVPSIPGAMIFDAYVQVDHVAARPVSIGLTIDNLFGTPYSHPGIRTADGGDEPGRWVGQAWVGSQGYYNSRLPQPGRLVMVTLGLDL